ncbi:hypothetical protein D9M71_268120 [compost metagenome]
MHEAHGHRGKHQDQAVPERRVLFLVDFTASFRSFVHFRQRIQLLQADQQKCGDDEASHWREHQREGDVDCLLPVDPVAQRQVGEQRVGQADAEDRADQGVRAGGGNAEVPGAEVPGDGCGEQREHHGQAVSGVHVDQQLHRQQVDDGIGDAHTAQQHAEEVEDAGQHHGAIGRHRLGVDDGRHRVGGVVEAIDELETEDEGQCQHEADGNPRIEPAEEIKHEISVTSLRQGGDYARSSTRRPEQRRHCRCRATPRHTRLPALGKKLETLPPAPPDPVVGLNSGAANTFRAAGRATH